MKRSTFTILFIAKKHKLLKNGKAPIYVRITINGKTAEIALKRSIEPNDWNTSKGISNKKNHEANELNHYINQMRYKIFEIQKDLEFEGVDVNAENIKNRLLGLDNEDITLLKSYKEHIDDLKKLIGKGIAASTVKKHETSFRHFSEFLKFKYNKNDISFKQITPKTIQDYEVFLKTERNCNQNSTVKYIRNVGKIIRIGLNNGWLKTDPFSNLSLKTVEVDKPFLTSKELQTLINKKFSSKRIEVVKDTFVFCCFTGLAFVDVSSLNENDIITGIDGKQWIKKQRQKTGNWCNIPLLPIPLQLIEKYKNNPVCLRKNVLLPVISNQKMNAYLKEIADLCGIEKELTTHIARHTFATTVTISNKVSMEAVSKMLGHSTLQMTKKYARIVDELISDEMNKIVNTY